MAFLHPATYLYISMQMWYGNIIPSCYLMNCSDIKRFIMERGWVTAMSKLFVKKPKDTVRRRNVENRPGENKRQGHKPDTVREEHNDGEPKMKEDQTTTNVKTKNKVEDGDTFYQTNRRKNRGVILHELSITSDHSLSDATGILPIHQNNANRRKCRIRKPLIENTEPSVFYICEHPNVPQNHNADTGNVSILLPNQVDYS